MAFPRKLLTEREEVISEVHPHWKAVIAPAFLGLLILAALIVSALKVHQPVIRIVILVAGVVLAWVLVAVPLLRRHFTRYVLTSERLIAQTGILAKRAKEIPLETINDITFTQSILDRMIGSGSLVLESAGEHGQEVLDQIPHPAEMQKKIYAAAEARRSFHRGGATVSTAEELGKLADLRDRGILTPEEFDARKRRMLES